MKVFTIVILIFCSTIKIYIESFQYYSSSVRTKWRSVSQQGLQHRQQRQQRHSTKLSMILHRSQPRPINFNFSDPEAWVQEPETNYRADAIVEKRKSKYLHDGLRMKRMPHSELIISEIGLGSGTFGGDTAQSDADTIMDLAFKECGINFIVRNFPIFFFDFHFFISILSVSGYCRTLPNPLPCN
jgi:hypothetical protein